MAGTASFAAAADGEDAMLVRRGGQFFPDSATLPVGQRWTVYDIKAKCRFRRNLVDVLTAGAGAAAEGEDEFVVGEAEVVVDADHHGIVTDAAIRSEPRP